MKSLDFEKVSVAEARRELDGGPKQVGKPAWKGDRTHQKNDVLLNTTLTWMASLPDDVRPTVLARRFPRIANRIGELWRRVARCEEYLDTLGVDQRGDRGGFPPDVVGELAKLRSYYAELHPSSESAWDLVERGR